MYDSNVIAALLLALTAQDPLRCSFVVVGCNRMGEKPWLKQKDENPSSANLPQLNRTLKDVAGLSPRPWAFFFVGDMVMNMAHDDGETLKSQLDGWADVIAKSPIAGTVQMIPVAGNHEMLWKLESPGVKEEYCNPACDRVWDAWLGRHPGFQKFAGNGPRAGQGPIADDQSKLSYSFDKDGEHYICLNSDTLTTEKDAKTGQPPIGLVPLDWLRSELVKADANPAIRDVFIFAHRPVSSIEPSDVSSSINPLQLEPTITMLKNSRKFRLWCCAHIHGYDLEQIVPGKWQVIAGNGGSKLEDYWQPKGGQFFGFTQVKVYQSGKIAVVDYRRPVPPGKQKEYEDEPVAPAAAKPSAPIWIR